MPYKVVENAGKYNVVNAETDEVKATHDDKADADRQVRILTEMEKGE